MNQRAIRFTRYFLRPVVFLSSFAPSNVPTLQEQFECLGYEKVRLTLVVSLNCTNCRCSYVPSLFLAYASVTILHIVW